MDQISFDSENKVIGIGEFIVGGKFRLEKFLSAGNCGNVFSGLNIISSEKVAIKTEKSDSELQMLFGESEVYRALRGGKHFPQLLGYGEERGFKWLVLNLLGPSLLHLQTHCSGSFSLKTVLMLGDQMISALEFLHDKNYVHRDIKQANFTIGMGQHKNQVYLIDFGMSNKYRDPEHIPYRDGVDVDIGAPRYASINAHQNIEQSRRDDLEALGYLLLHFLKGSLPWMVLVCESKIQLCEETREMKMQIPVELLCKDCPEFEMYLKYCRGLRFEETPDYEYLRELFRTRFRALNYEYDYEFDWCTVQTNESDKLQDDESVKSGGVV